jgi:hypothetical protein
VLYPNFATTDANGAWSATATAHDPGMYVEILSVDSVPAAPLSFFVLATRPAEVMQNTSNPSISPNLVVGDSFVQTITAGPNAAYQPVVTVFNGTTYNLGQTDQNGAIVLQGIGKDVGSYTITYVVGGMPATPPLSFTVASAGTVPSFTPLAPPVVIMELPNLSTTGACTSIAGTWAENTAPVATWTIEESDECQSRFCGNVKGNIDSCGTVTWNVTGSLTNPSTGTFSLSATNPSPSCRGIPLPPVASATESVTLSATDCASGNGNHTISSGVFATNWQDAAPASPRIPTSLSVKTGPRQVFNGGPAVDCKGNVDYSSAYGYLRCLTYTTLDQKKKPILNTTNYRVEEVITVVVSTFSGDPVIGSGQVNKDGKFLDMLRIAKDGLVPTGSKGVFKQVVTIRDTTSGTPYQVRVNCIVFSATDVKVNDVTTSADQSCFGLL